MKKFVLSLAILYSGVCQAAFPGKLDVYALLLASPNTDDVKMGANAIQEDGVKLPALLDLVAERMCMYVHADADSDMDMDAKRNRDTVSWLAKALGGSGDAKYRPFLEEALAKTKQGHNKDDFREALAGLPAATPGAAYEPSCPTLADFRAQALAGRSPAKVSFKDASGFKPGDTLDAVIAKLGSPTTARYYLYQTSHFLIHIHHENILISYLGAAAFQFDDDGNGTWYIVRTIENAADPAVTPTSPDAELLDGVLSGSKEVVSDTGDRMEDQKLYPTDVLDAAARRFWYQRDTTDDDTLDALDEVGDILSDSKNPRYRTLLTQVSQQAKEKRLRKYAASALSDLGPGDAEQLPVPTD
jgi:hypothetical protein